MKRVGILVTAIALVVATAPGAAAAERLTDQQVKSLIEQVDKNYERWKDGLEKANMDDAVIKSAAGTIDVKQFLKGFKDDISKLKDKFKPENAAVAEVTQLLRKANDVERRHRERGVAAAGSEWTALSNSLGSLAAAYGGAWPLESLETQFVRMNDKDMVGRLDAVQRMIKQFSNEVGKAKDTVAPKADRDALKADAKQLEQVTKDLASRLKDGKPASAEAKGMVQQLTKMQPKVAALQGFSPPGNTAWGEMVKGGQAVAMAFGEPMPR